MIPFLSPVELIRLQLRTGFILAEAQMVIGMRMMGLMGLWRVLPTENARMSSEKISAFGEAALASSAAMLAGKSPAKVAEAALKPVARATKSNVKRLARRGPGKP